MQKNISSSLQPEDPWWALFWKSFKRSLRNSPRAYFAPLVGAIAGAIEYTNAAHQGLPGAQSRIRIYANAMRSVAEHMDLSDDYRSTLLRTLLIWGRDKAKPVPLSGDLDQDLKALGIKRGLADIEEGEGR